MPTPPPTATTRHRPPLPLSMTIEPPSDAARAGLPPSDPQTWVDAHGDIYLALTAEKSFDKYVRPG